MAESAHISGKEMAFNAGTHHEFIKMLYTDYEKLVKPTLASFAFQKK